MGKTNGCLHDKSNLDRSSFRRRNQKNSNCTNNIKYIDLIPQFVLQTKDELFNQFR